MGLEPEAKETETPDAANDEKNTREAKKCKIEIVEASRLAPAEMNTAFFQEVFPPKPDVADVVTEEDFLNRLRENLEMQFDAASDDLLRLDYFDGLYEDLELEMPDELLRKRVEEEAKAKKEMDEAENETENEKEEDPEKAHQELLRFLRFRTFQNKVRREYELKISDSEVKQRALFETMDAFQSYFGQVSPEFVFKLVESRLKEDEEYVEEIFSKVIREKVFNAIKDRLEPSEELMKASGFEDFMKAKNAKKEEADKTDELEAQNQEENTKEEAEA